jgi:(1->4)-alpha-D-glucan 1-alpha-D-glucosylmutase
MERYLCIHGHFYQPPRENPWLEAVEQQDSAYPFHDWNERITAECYAPNGVARILDDRGRIARLVNNYSRISFNFGPTLLAWLEERAPDVYRSILDADGFSRERFSGHGSALAQIYNHVILPLANRRDKYTQVSWGLRDFEHRFGRRPEGMWLAETAADLETFDVLAELGIRFTILSPHQARRVRPLQDHNAGEEGWQDVSGGRIDPTRPYVQRLPSGRSLVLFFYDGPISRGVAFERLLTRGEDLVARLLTGFADGRDWPQLVHIATDGESYGHHHSHGDMALAYALEHIANNPDVRLTNYGEYLERHPPSWEADIFENTSWSCVHGVERWRSDCGCSMGRPGWNQAWRRPLREALDWLRDALAPSYEKAAARFFRDPWAARNDSIAIIFDRSPESVERFLREHASRELGETDRATALKLLELQRQALLMYTSCGWFFDEISGIETVQILQYAGRALQLGAELFEEELEKPFLALLEKARSNLPDHGDGRRVYEKFVKSTMVGWEQIGAHYAISSLFESYPQEARFFCYTAEREFYEALAAGRSKLVVGRARLRSDITQEAVRLSFGVLHFGDHHVSAGVRVFQGEVPFAELTREATDAFRRSDFAEVIRAFDRRFGASTYSLQSLFRDEQRKVIKRVLSASIIDAENAIRQVHEHHLPTMHFLAGMGAPLPRVFEVAAEFLLNTDLRWDLKDEEPDLAHIRGLFAEARTLHVRLDTAGLAYRLRKTLARMADRLRSGPDDLALLRNLEEVIDLARSLTFEVDFWKPQNVYCELADTAFPEALRRLEEGDRHQEAWLEQFLHLGEKLGVRVTDLRQQMNEVKAAPTAADLVREVLAQRRVPRATYRLQFNHHFTFKDALEQVAYLHELGISDAYASPILAARPGSSHGYDVCDPTRLNPELGGEEGFDALAAALRQHGMGLVLDMVSNHMGIGHPSNLWWNDVLENGPSSIYASWFDISWSPVNPALANKVLLPILEDQYGNVLEAGKIRLTYEGGAFAFSYYDKRLPVEPGSYAVILRRVLERLIESVGKDNEAVRELQSILTALGYLPARTEADPDRVAERNREKEVVKGRIGKLVAESKEAARAVEEVVRRFNGRPGEPASFDLLDELLDAQSFRPAYWRVATEEINYRRFFDINELAAICVERPEVFRATHQLYFRLLAEGKATGLRIDHPDGLWDPTAYFRQLQEEYVLARLRQRLGSDREEDFRSDVREALTAEQNGSPRWPLYVVAEKILTSDEALPRTWTVDGTTGYDFLNLVNGLFINAAHEPAFEHLYASFSEATLDFHRLANSTKKTIMLVSMASEINALSHQLDRISERNRRYRDFTLNSLTFVIREFIACLPVYRTYVTDPESVAVRDRSFIDTAIEEAKQLNPRTAESIFDFVRDTVLLRKIQDFREEDRPRLSEWAMRFQQVTGPVMAKGVEDTALYVYNRLASLNEVGGAPNQFGVALEKFHRVNAERQQSWPHALLATSTHDTKRSEDVRARLNVLSEIPDEWQQAVERWRSLNASKRTAVDGAPAPDGNDEYLLYQTLLGAWPCEPLTEETYTSFRERIAGYMHKATKEAKVHTSWINANEEYDEAVRNFVFGILPAADRRRPEDPTGNGEAGGGFRLPSSAFLQDLVKLARRVAWFGYFNALSQVLLKCTCPGVPDFYQGTELWDLSLVDPDNRRPVNYGRRRELLGVLKEWVGRLGDDLTPLTKELLANLADGRIKLYLTWRALSFRQEQGPLFAEGAYEPLEAAGAQKEHVCAFARTGAHAEVVVVVPRLLVELTGGREQLPMGPAVWQDTWLALPETSRGQRYRHHFTSETFAAGERDGRPGLELGQLLGSFPVALLVRLA